LKTDPEIKLPETEVYNPRIRFVKHSLFEPVDRVPYIETHGFWPQAVARWHKEGLPSNVRHKSEKAEFGSDDITIETYFQQEVYSWPPMMGSPTQTPFYPPFEKIILEENDEYVIFRDSSGITKKDTKQGRSMPQFLKFPVQSKGDWQALKRRLDAGDESRYATARQAAEEGFNERDHLVPYVVCGAYGMGRNLFGEVNVALAYYDVPDLMHDIMKHWLAFYVENAQRFAEIIDFDFVYFWEDMAFKTGPLVGPNLAGQFIAPYYRELIQEMRKVGFKIFALDSDGNNKELMDDFIDAGINNFLPCEIAADMEPQWISGRYGKRCSIQGGIDKRALTKGKAEIEAEVMRKVPELLKHGGYIPGVDHGTPNDVPFENFCYLVELLRKLGREIKPNFKEQ